MKIVLFCHSLVSDWNHGNAHFLRGIVTELQGRGHRIDVYEPHDAWSVQNLLRHEGSDAIDLFRREFPHLQSTRYQPETLDLDAVLADADLVIVHEWNETALIHALGEHRQRNDHYRLLFHDTHHRSISDSETIAGYQLEKYDGVLAFGEVIRQRYLETGWAQQAWTWHEAADTNIFYPHPADAAGDLVWIGNWGDDERTTRLEEFLFQPVEQLGLRALIHGVRYPAAAQKRLTEANINYGGWLPNFRAPQLFGHFRVTVHVPRAPYLQMLPGIPTIRVFEALACGIPLICSPWDDAEGLFSPGEDFLVAHDGAEMQKLLRLVLHEQEVAQSLASHGLDTILERHTCGHRVDELLTICEHDLGLNVAVDGTNGAPDMSSNEQPAVRPRLQRQPHGRAKNGPSRHNDVAVAQVAKIERG